MSKLNGLKRMSQSLKRRTVSLGKNIGEGFANIPIRKRGNSLVVNRKSVSNIGDFVDVAKDNVESAQEDMLEDARKAIDEAQKFNVASAIKVLEEAGISESEKRKVIKKLKEYFQKEGNKLTLFIKKKFGSLNKDVKELEKEEKSAESKKDFNQMLKNNGKTNKLSNNSPVTECMEIFTEDLPKTTKEGQNKTTAVLNKLGAGTTQLIEDAIANALAGQLNKKTIEKMYDEFESTLNTKLVAACKKEIKPDLKTSPSGLTIGTMTCKNIKDVKKACNKEYERSRQAASNLYEAAKETTLKFAKDLTEKLRSATNYRKNYKDKQERDKAIEKDIGDLFMDPLSCITNGVASFNSRFQMCVNSANDMFKNKKTLEEMKQDFEKFKNEGIDLKDEDNYSALKTVINFVFQPYDYSSTMDKIKGLFNGFKKKIGEKLKFE